MELYAANPITAFQVILQMVHRLIALGICILVAVCAWQAWHRLGKKDSLARFALFWFALIVSQIALGAATIWTNKAADVATLHVMVGALSLVTGALWCVIGFSRSEALAGKNSPVVFGAAPALAGNK
jgi:cytochrome c oxidase assembly protein subunit 15